MTDDIVLPPLTDDELQFIHDNPNTNNVAKWVDDRARAAVLADRERRAQPAPEAEAWIPVSKRLPEKGALVLVYSPPESGDWPDSVRIDLDFLDPDSDGNAWHGHNEHYEHYCIVAKGGDVAFTGPGEQAPYTHWAHLPAPPAAHSAGKGGEE